MALDALKGIMGSAASKAPPPAALPPGLEDEDEDADVTADAELTASEDMLVAQESGDAAAYGEALKRFMKACGVETNYEAPSEEV
jgi:hypothetical protein